MEDKEQEVQEVENKSSKGKMERTELPEGYEWRYGCKSCSYYQTLLSQGLFLPLDFSNNLPVPAGPSATEKMKNGEKIDFWVRHNKTGRTEVVDKKWYEANKKRLDMEHIKQTTCRFKRIYQHKVVDEVTGKEVFKDYCAYWKKSELITF